LPEGKARNRANTAHELHSTLLKRATQDLTPEQRSQVTKEIAGATSISSWDELSPEAQHLLDMLGVFGVPTTVVSASGERAGSISPVLLGAFAHEGKVEETQEGVHELNKSKQAVLLALRYPAMRERPDMSVAERADGPFPEINPSTFVSKNLRDDSGEYDIGFLNEVVGMRSEIADNGGTHDTADLESFVEWILKQDNSLEYESAAGVFVKKEDVN
jgi:hypothetical protein